MRAGNTDGSTLANAGDGWVFTTGVSGDAYEDDDIYTDASAITNGVTQDHSIDPVGDLDWVTFTLGEESGITLATSGLEDADTRLYLYDSTGTNQIGYDDDNITDAYSTIERPCASNPLPAGTYYAKVDEYGNNDLIGEYQLDLSVTTCGGPGGDAYEDDDIYTDASLITSGVSQDHSIDPVGDLDWVTFTLTGQSAVTLETSGPAGDTRLYLYDDSGTNEIGFSDDDGTGMFSLIEITCGDTPLVAGTYYAMVDEYSNDDIIEDYQLDLSVTSCGRARGCLRG